MNLQQSESAYASEIDFTAKRAAAEQHLAREKAARGAALADGKPLAHKRVVDAEQDITALGEAEAVITRRQREEAAIALRQRRAGIVEQIGLAEVARLDRIADAERSARTFVAALNAALAAAASERRLLAQIGAETPTPIGPLAVVDRLASRTAALFTGITGCRTAFGHLLLVPGFFTPGDDWRQQEAKQTSAALATLKGN